MAVYNNRTVIMQKKIGIALIALGVIILGVTVYLIMQFGGFNLSDFGVLSALTALGVFIGALAPSSTPILAEENNIIEPTEI